MKKTVAILIVVWVLLAVLGTRSLGAQATRPVNEGVYTADQAKTRRSDLQGDSAPRATATISKARVRCRRWRGKDFLTNWQGKTVGDLYEKTQTTMPATAPGTLTPAQAADILAFLLEQG